MIAKLKIVFFADAGVEHTIRWVKFFADLGHEVHVISWNDFSKGSASYRLDDIRGSFHPATLHVLGGKRPETSIRYILWVVALVLRIRALINKIQPDLLHSHSVGAHAWITLFLPDIKAILTPWGTDVLVDMKKSQINRMLSVQALKKCTSITVDAEHMKQELIDFGIDPLKINVIYFGTDTAFYVRSEQERVRLRQKYCIRDDDVVVISTRTLNPIHDVFSTLKAVPIVLQQKKNIKFIIASDGIDRQAMEEYVDERGLRDHVIFPGYMTMSEMVSYLSASDIYVSSSKADAGLSASTAEAMSIGLPVVVSDNSENAFWVKDSGILFQDGDADGISSAVMQLANDFEMIEKLGRNGRARISRDNDYATEMSKVHSLYTDVCSNLE